MEGNYDNQHLARDYIRVSTVYLGVNQGHINCKRAIIKSEVDIPGFYRKNKGLAGLKVMGIGSQTLRILELILREGVEDAAKKIADERTESLHIPTLHRTNIRRLSHEDSCSDNHERLLEKD